MSVQCLTSLKYNSLLLIVVDSKEPTRTCLCIYKNTVYLSGIKLLDLYIVKERLRERETVRKALSLSLSL